MVQWDIEAESDNPARGPWRIELLGGLRAVRPEAPPVERFPTRKMGALLALLALDTRRRRSREEVADLIWPDADLSSARDRISQALVWLRRRLEPEGAARGSVLIADRREVGLEHTAVTTDVAEFDAALAAARRAPSEPARTAALLRAVSLYRGQLLPGYYEDWVLTERDRLRDACVFALRQLSERELARGDREGALDFARRAVEADPLGEEANADVMRLLLASGQRAAALRRFDELARRLARELGGGPSPALVALKEQARREAALPRAAEAGTPPPTPPAPLPQPTALTPLVGREALIATVVSAVRSEDGRLTTLTGTGGAGKTRLALAVLEELAAGKDDPAAVAFVPLADVEQARLIPDAVAAALRLPGTSHRPALDLVADALAVRPAVLVLDNLEHLLDGAAPRIAELLARVPSLRLLVTSRQRIGIGVEREVPVPPLDFPPPSAALEEVRAAASVRLFEDRARAVRPEFSVTPANASLVADICARLDGLPLAIELCAAWAQMLTPAQMRDRLERRFDLLVSRRADIPARHRSLRAALEYSYLLLPTRLQRLFTRLSVFRGGWTLDSAAVVCADEGDAEGATAPAPLGLLHELTELRERSLIVAEEVAEGEHAEMRYHMLDSLREFAGELLSYSDQAEGRRAHAHHFADLAEQARPGMDGPAQDLWLARLDRERENLRAALTWCAETGDGELGLRLAGALSGYWAVRGPLGEGRDWLARLLAREDAGTLPPAVRGRAWTALGYLAWVGGEFPTARDAHEKALALWRAAGDDAQTGESLYHLGITAYRQSDYAAARENLLESLRLARDGGDRAGVARVLLNLGNIASELEGAAAARPLYEQSLALERELGNRRRIANALNNLGLLAQGGGDYAKAAALFEEALALRRELTDHYGAVTELANLGTVARLLGHRERALALLAEGLERAYEFGDRYNMLHYLLQIGLIEADGGDPARSVVLLSAARHHFEEVMNSPRIETADGYPEAVEANRAALGDRGYEAGWESGRTTPLGEIVALALVSRERTERPAD